MLRTKKTTLEEFKKRVKDALETAQDGERVFVPATGHADTMVNAVRRNAHEDRKSQVIDHTLVKIVPSDGGEIELTIRPTGEGHKMFAYLEDLERSGIMLKYYHARISDFVIDSRGFQFTVHFDHSSEMFQRTMGKILDEHSGHGKTGRQIAKSFATEYKFLRGGRRKSRTPRRKSRTPRRKSRTPRRKSRTPRKSRSKRRQIN